MTPWCSNTTRQVDVHEDFDPGQRKGWVALVESSQRGGNLQTNDDGNGACGQYQLRTQDLFVTIASDLNSGS